MLLHYEKADWYGGRFLARMQPDTLETLRSLVTAPENRFLPLKGVLLCFERGEYGTAIRCYIGQQDKIDQNSKLHLWMVRMCT